MLWPIQIPDLQLPKEQLSDLHQFLNSHVECMGGIATHSTYYSTMCVCDAYAMMQYGGTHVRGSRSRTSTWYMLPQLG
jgi:hypothetical protein